MGLLNEAYIYEMAEDAWRKCSGDVEPIEASRIEMEERLASEIAQILGDDYLEDESGVVSNLAYEIVHQYVDFEDMAERNREASPWQEAQRDLVNEVMHSL